MTEETSASNGRSTAQPAEVPNGPELTAPAPGSPNRTHPNLRNLGRRDRRRPGAGVPPGLHHPERPVGEGVLLHRECPHAAWHRSAPCSDRRRTVGRDRGVITHLAAPSPPEQIEVSWPHSLGHGRSGPAESVLVRRPTAPMVDSKCPTVPLRVQGAPSGPAEVLLISGHVRHPIDHGF